MPASSSWVTMLMAIFRFDNFICEQKLVGLWGCQNSVENIYGFFGVGLVKSLDGLQWERVILNICQCQTLAKSGS